MGSCFMCNENIAVYSRIIPFHEIFFPISTCFSNWLVGDSAVLHIGIPGFSWGKMLSQPIGKHQRGTLQFREFPAESGNLGW